jgi:KUP system potassium uptake protein
MARSLLGSHGDARAPRLSITIAALGVVFGDIGTSPLYALRACFEAVDVPIERASVFGVLSLIFWALALVITLKYISIVLRADNEGEGGVLALMTLVLKDETLSRRRTTLVGFIGLSGCALFYGDGVITPAVTVLGALEGLAIAAPALERTIVPATLLILLWLFKLQRRGTGAIGSLFGPFMLVWFATLGILGARFIAAHPSVLAAASPFYAVEFFAAHPGLAFAVMGAVFLAVTGGEALYTDLGHFGRSPITRAWFVIVWPCLLLNYFGQGALLLEQPSAIENPFYLLAPSWGVVPLLLLATGASVIASQAVLSGVFAITQQCQQLGFIPRLRMHHSSSLAFAQVYVPAVNWIICAAALGLVVGFRSSAAITNAYGVGVSITMLIDSVLMILLLRSAKKTAWRISTVVLAVVLLLDLIFVSANLLKVPAGGWFPLVFGLALLGLMRTWQAGRIRVTQRMRREERTVAWLGQYIQARPVARVPGVAVFLTSSTTGIPRTLVRNLNLNGVLHDDVLLVTLQTERVPRFLQGSRFKIENVGLGLHRVIIRIGFMEEPDVPKLLQEAKRAGLPVRTEDAVYFVGHDELVVTDSPGMLRWRKLVVLFLSNNSQFAGASFGIPPTRLMEVGGQVEI